MWSDSLSSSLCLALCLHFSLVIYGLWQDSTMTVKYTDIDYVVFSDAAKFMSKGFSPYRRATYRYTPILAWLLQGNIYISETFGKAIFAICDIAVGCLIYRYILLKYTGIAKQTAIICAQLWLFNPLPMTVSTRGNAEAVMAILVLATLYLISDFGPLCTSLSAVIYGISVHMKIYPATYAVSMFMHLNEHAVNKQTNNCFRVGTSSYHVRCLVPTSLGMIFGVTSLISFSFATASCYLWYGDDFLQNAYLYHLTRQDIKHNFSPYFYMLYLTSDSAGTILSLSMFIPQLLLMFVIAYKYHSDIAFACFLQTFTFVIFNKVCTSQYFLWYLCLLPLIAPWLKLRRLYDAILLGIPWLAGQGLWLMSAYLLEFHGQNVFLSIWLAGLLFFSINIYILYRLLTLYSPVQHST
jgi:phosphatidylinositol glycan class M